MSSPDKVFLHDRIKEISYDTGTGNFRLDGAIKGFAPFSNFYASGDAVFYAITDGTDWEVGSGQYIFDGSTKAIKRFSFNSSNSDNNVNFQAGVKEVFVSYPGKFSIFSANGMSTFNKPAASGLAFFASPHIVDYSSNLIWNTSNNKLGVTKSDPEYSIDVGGALSYSSARVSGVIVGESGIMFSGVSSSYASSYSGGRQLEPFMRNELDPTTGSNAIFSLSGLVDQRILLDTQVKGSVFAGPVSGCGAGDCSPDYPTFRYLTLEDIPDLSTLYTQQYNASYSGDIAFYRDSGVVEYDHFLNWDKTNNYLGVNRCDPQYTLDVDGNTSISGELDVQQETFLHDNLNVSGNVVISGNLDVQGNLTYIDSSTVTIWDKQLELASMSGTALANDAAIDDGGLVIKSSDSDKKWTWRDVDDAWRTEQNVGVSGTLKASGNSIFGNNLSITNALTASGAAEFHDTLKTSGDATFYQDVLVNEGLKVSGTLSVSGSTIIDNIVNIYDNAYLHDNTFLKSNATISGNLDVSGVSFLNNELKTSGNVIFGKDLLVTNNMTTSGNAGISGNLDVNRDLFIYGSTYYDQDVTISGTLGVSGNATFDNNVIVKGDAYTAGNATTSGSLNTSGNAFFNSDTYTVGSVTTSGTLNTSGNVFLNSDTYTVGNSTTSGTLNTSGNVFFNSDTYTAGNATTSGIFNASGVSIFNEDAYFTSNAPVVMSGTLGVSGYASLDKTLLFTDSHIKIGTSAADDYKDAVTSIHIGSHAGHDGSGQSTVAIGNQAGYRGSGLNYTFVGANAGLDANYATSLVGVGSQASSLSSGCSYGVHIGHTAGKIASGCPRSVFTGVEAGLRASGVGYSVLIGHSAGKDSLGSQNTANDIFLGRQAGINSSGNSNIFIGTNAGAITSGNNILEITNVGNTLFPNVVNNSNKLNINEIIVGDTSTKRLSIGNVSATHLSPNATLEIVPNGTDVALLASGNVYVSGDSTFSGMGTFGGNLDQRNGINATSHRVFKTYTSATDYEAIKIGSSGNYLSIASESGVAGGNARDININGIAFSTEAGGKIMDDTLTGNYVDFNFGNKLALGGATTIVIRAGAGPTTYLYNTGHHAWGGIPTYTSTLSASTGDEYGAKIDYTVNKSSSGDDTGLIINQTDTASPGVSRLIDGQVGTVSKFSVSNSGDVNVSGLVTLNGGLALKETTTPTALADYGKVYTKADNKLYFQDGAGTEHEIAFA